MQPFALVAVLGILVVVLGSGDGLNGTSSAMAFDGGAKEVGTNGSAAELRSSRTNSTVSWKERANITETHWRDFVKRYDQWIGAQQYCLSWCKVNRSGVNHSLAKPWPPWNLYPDFPPDSLARKHAVSLPPYVGEYQRKTKEGLKVECCHICTQRCFRTVVDTRRQGFWAGDATLITVVTPGRFEAVERIRQLWSGPIVILLYCLVKPLFVWNGQVVPLTSSPS